MATLEVYGRPISGSPLGTHTYGVLTVISNEYSQLIIPLSPEFGNCNSLLGQLIEIAGGNFDVSKLPWNAIDWSHRMKSNLFEK